MVMTPVVTTRTVSGMAEPEGAGVVPIGLLVNHHGIGLRFHEHTPKGEREGNESNN
jgi:hypothetical protein